jgi:hypothetical protein
MSKAPVGPKPIATAIAAASAAGIPLGTAAAQPPDQPWIGTTVSVEGGVAFSNYWQTTVPGGPASLLPSPDNADKVGSTPISSGPLQSNNNIGGYGSFSISSTYQGSPTIDWRFSAAFYGFGTTSSSASASQFVSGEETSFTNTAAITETDRFSFETFDFDFGQKFTQGPVQFRAFAGLRGLHTDELFTTNVATSGLDKIGFDTFAVANTNVFSQGSSQFIGVGPRVGVDFNTMGTWGFVGSVSVAWIEGSRQSQYMTTTTASIGGSPPTVTPTGLFNDRYVGVGNLEGMIGVAWQFSANGEFVVGYKVDEWYNIRDSFSFAGFNNKQDVLTQTPFLRVTLRY